MKRPSLQTIVSLAEVISALAIVISLLYVAYEFRRGETLSSRDVENIVYQRMLEMDRLVVENPEFVEVLVRARSDPEGLTPAEQVRFLAFEHIFFDSWESAWYYHQEGILTETSWNSWNTWFIADAKRRPVLGWTGNRRHFAGGFLEHVDRHLLAGSDRPKTSEP